jgi:capsular exopolysaccharide synthesis family protein
MDHIRQAIERAKGSGIADNQPQVQTRPASQQAQVPPNADNTGTTQSWGKEVVLNGANLVSNRIVSHDIGDVRSKSFDMLRTQVLQSMDKASWQVIGVTSPTPDCGKSVIAANLALSMARMPHREVLLVDMDLQKPQLANYLGMKCDQGMLSVLEGRTNLSSSLIQARIRNQQLLVLPCEKSTPNSSALMASRTMSALLQEIRHNFKAYTVIIDLPPILTSDDVITILPQIDCVLFVTAIGSTTVAEIKECNKYLESTPIVQVVANKAPDTATTYYYYSAYAKHLASQVHTVP